MREDLQIALFRKYEGFFDLFVSSGPASRDSSRIKCGDGWFAIIDVLSGVLLDLHRTIQVENIQATNRRLSYIVSHGDNLGEMGAIVAAQLFSERVCEETGLPTGYPARQYAQLKPPERGATFKFLSDERPRRNPDPIREEDGCRSSSPKPREIGDHLRWKHGLRSDARVDLPARFFDLADCSISAVKHFLNPGRFDLARLSCPQLLSITWHETNGLEMKVSDDAAVNAALKTVAYNAAFFLVDGADLSPVLLENRISSNISQIEIFANKMAIRLYESKGSMTQ